ncbi:MAG: hypothetical protein AAF518_08410, partial [Spirochaetota bacterium]
MDGKKIPISHQSFSSQNILEWQSIVKTSETLIHEFDLDILKKKIIDIVINSTGAQRGVLLLRIEDDVRLMGVLQAADNCTQSSRRPVPTAR